MSGKKEVSQNWIWEVSGASRRHYWLLHFTRKTLETVTDDGSKSCDMIAGHLRSSTSSTLRVFGTDSEYISGAFDKLGDSKHGKHYQSEGILGHLRKPEEENKREDAWGGEGVKQRVRK